MRDSVWRWITSHFHPKFVVTKLIRCKQTKFDHFYPDAPLAQITSEEMTSSPVAAGSPVSLSCENIASNNGSFNVAWRRFGSENGQFREGISVTNTSHGLTLFIENVWENDTDTYECIVWNNNALPSIRESTTSFHLQVIGESSKRL